MDFSAYEKGNPFMSYNHIQICKVDPDCCVVKVNLVAESMNLHTFISALPIKMIIFFVMVWLICIVFQDAKHRQASAILRIHT